MMMMFPDFLGMTKTNIKKKEKVADSFPAIPDVSTLIMRAVCVCLCVCACMHEDSHNVVSLECTTWKSYFYANVKNCSHSRCDLHTHVTGNRAESGGFCVCVCVDWRDFIFMCVDIVSKTTAEQHHLWDEHGFKHEDYTTQTNKKCLSSKAKRKFTHVVNFITVHCEFTQIIEETHSNLNLWFPSLNWIKDIYLVKITVLKMNDFLLYLIYNWYKFNFFWLLLW